MRPRTLLAIGVVIWGLLIIAAVVLVVDYNTESSQVLNAKDFLQSAMEGREDAALAHLSPARKAKVQQECPNGLVSACIEHLISPTWGELTKMVGAAWQPGLNSLLLHTFWTHDPGNPIPVVILTHQENGKWVIDGWRGFVLLQDATGDGQLLDGMRHDNEFMAL